MEKSIIFCICVTIVAVVACLLIIESIGTFYGDIVYARFIFALGIFVGIMVMFLSRVFAYTYLDKIKKEIIVKNE